MTDSPQASATHQTEINALQAQVAQLQDQLAATHTRHRQLHEYGLGIIRHTEFAPLVQDIVKRACHLADTEHSYLSIIDDNDLIRCEAATGLFSRFVGIGPIRQLDDEGISGQVVSTGEPVVVYDYDRWEYRVNTMSAGSVYSTIGLPLRIDGRIIGILGIAYTEPGRQFNKTLLQDLESFADIVSVALDRANLTNQLEVSQEFIERINHTVPVGLYTIDLKADHYTYMNQGFADILGYPLEDLQQSPNPLKSLIHQDDRQRVLEMQQALADADTEYEFRVKHGDGHWAWLRRLDRVVMRDADGVPMLCVGTVQDVTAQYEVTEALKQREAQLRLMFEGSATGILLGAPDGTIIRANPQFGQMLGYTPDELTEMAFSDLCHPEDRAEELNLIQRLKQTGRTNYQIEKRYIHKDKSVVWGRATVTMLTGLNDIANITFVEDISETVLAQAALNSSERRFQAIFESAALGITTAKTNGKLLLVNDKMLQLTGYSRADFETITVQQLTHPDDIKKELPLLQGLMNGDYEHYQIEKRHIHKKGHIYWVKVTISTIHDSKDTVIALVEDINDRKLAEARLQASEERFRTLLDHMPAILLIFRQGEVTYINPAGSRLLKAPVEAIMGKNFANYVDNDGIEWVKERIELYQTTRAAFPRHEIGIYDSEGQHHIMDVSVIPVKLVDGNALIVTAIDITERKQNEHNQIALAVERERIGILSSFIKNAGHDFRNPLAVINTSLHLLSRTDDPEKRAARRDMIAKQVEHLDRLVDALLLMVRHDTNVPLTLIRMNLNQLVRDTSIKLIEIAKMHDITLQLSLSPDELPVFFSTQDLQIAIANVIENAINYTAGPGEIYLETYKQDNNAIIIVSDTGDGISEVDLPKIFDRFYRGARGQEEGGLGLGLAISRKIIERHEGTIHVKSELGSGSQFTISVPLAEF